MKNKNKGISILGILLIGVIVVLVLSYFKVSIKSVVESPTGQENIEYVKGGTKSLWEAYLKEPATYLWNKVFVDIFWAAFIDNMERIRDGKPTDYEISSPNNKY